MFFSAKVSLGISWKSCVRKLNEMKSESGSLVCELFAVAVCCFFVVLGINHKPSGG